jgi:hypothetical protein
VRECALRCAYFRACCFASKAYYRVYYLSGFSFFRPRHGAGLSTIPFKQASVKVKI